jgi:hypothetical protein
MVCKLFQNPMLNSALAPYGTSTTVQLLVRRLQIMA